MCMMIIKPLSEKKSNSQTSELWTSQSGVIGPQIAQDSKNIPSMLSMERKVDIADFIDNWDKYACGVVKIHA